VTVTGTALPNPSNLLVRMGTSTANVLAAVGGMPENTAKIISGGPMMGKAIQNLEVPIMKGSSGVLCMTEAEAHRKKESNCIRCGRCVDGCPMGLEPYLLYALSKKNMIAELNEHNIRDCFECGSCSFSCPAHKPLLDYIRLGKANVMQMIKKEEAAKAQQQEKK